MWQRDRQSEQDSAEVEGGRVVAPPQSPGFLAAGNLAVSRLVEGRGIGAIALEAAEKLKRASDGAGAAAAPEPKARATRGRLQGSVGVNGENQAEDVETVNLLLMVAGYLDPDIGAGITRYQREVLKVPKPDGKVDPDGRTFKALTRAPLARMLIGLDPEEGPAAAGRKPGTSQPGAPRPSTAPAADEKSNSVLNWPAVLPMSTRSGKTNITQVPSQWKLDIPEMDAPELTDAQKAIVEQIKVNRAALPEDKGLRKAKPRSEKSQLRGMVYNGDNYKGQLPTALKGDTSGDKAKEIKKALYEELGSEGSFNSINTWDGELFTYGQGFASSGMLPEVLANLFEDDPEARHELQRAGIDFQPGKGAGVWRVVDTERGVIETGQNALRLLQFDKKLLTVFINLGRGEHAQHVIDAQWSVVEDNAGKIPDFANSWSIPAIRLAAHLSHWTPAYGWEMNKANVPRYKATGGDLVKIAGTWSRISVGGKKDFNSIRLANGAIIGPSYMMDKGRCLREWANGAGGEAVENAADKVTVTPEELRSDSKYAGHVLFPVPGQKNMYWDIGTAGA